MCHYICSHRKVNSQLCPRIFESVHSHQEYMAGYAGILVDPASYLFDFHKSQYKIWSFVSGEAVRTPPPPNASFIFMVADFIAAYFHRNLSSQYFINVLNRFYVRAIISISSGFFEDLLDRNG